MRTIEKSKSSVLNLVILAITLGAVVFLLWPYFAKAIPTTDQQTWPWTVEKPVVFESSSITDISTAGTCPDVIELKDILETTGLVTKDVCLTEGKHFRYGTYFTGNIYIPVVSFGYDSMMYRIKGTSCGEPGTCVYLPETDTLAVKIPVSSLISTLELYKNFSKRVKKSVQGPIPLNEYTFDTSEPDYVFQSSNGYKWPVGGIGGSRNGKWLAVEIRQRGIAILDTETLKMRRVSPLSFQYYFGSMPSTELAISDDGAHVAIAGVNAHLTILDTYPGCGDEATDLRLQEQLRIEQPCPSASIDHESIVTRFKNAIHPRFNDDGGELRFYATSYLGESRLVFMRTASYVTPRMDYIALGDSFSSGEGETNDYYYLPGTNTEFERCHVSSRSYPFLLAQSMALDPRYMRSVACSGALMNDVIGDNDSYWGQGKRLDDEHLNVAIATKPVLQTTASEQFIPGRIHQIRFVSRYHPKVVTIGIGGNDAGLVKKLASCLSNNTCSWAANTKYREQTAYEIRSLFDHLASLYRAIRKSSPKTEVYVIGYPKIIDLDGSCGPILGKMLDPIERRFMDESITYINQVIAAAAERAGVRYIDISDAFGDSRLCGSTSPSVMNAIRTGDDQVTIGDIKLVGSESFHPRPQGHVLIANAIINAVGNLTYHRYCPEEILFCETNTTVPEPSAYWRVDGVSHGYNSLRNEEFVSDDVSNSDEKYKTVALPANSLEPGSHVRIEIHSDPIILADTMASDDGSLSLSIQLPSNLEDGAHTFYLYGTTFSGEKVDLYQIYQPTPPDTDTSTSEKQSPELVTINSSTSDQSQASNSISPESTATDDTESGTPIVTSLSTPAAVLGASDTKIVAQTSLFQPIVIAVLICILTLVVLVVILSLKKLKKN